jgi:hypothetical protein
MRSKIGGLAALVAAGAIAVTASPSARADLFTMCPDGHEGVVGGHTSCLFAQNVRDGYFRWGTHFRAYSPVTGEWYIVDCDPRWKSAYFEAGVVVSSINCYASSNAEVVIW